MATSLQGRGKDGMETGAELDQGRTEQLPLLERKGGHNPPIADFGRKQGGPQGKGALTVCSRPGRHEGRGVGVGGRRAQAEPAARTRSHLPARALPLGPARARFRQARSRGTQGEE